jgi:hypothetical protein
MENGRSVRLAEVERLSRKPHAELHSKLLDVVLGSLGRLTLEEWLALAKKSPDRLVQALSMSGRLAGYSERNEVAVGDHWSWVEKLSDSEFEAKCIERATESLERLAAAVPSVGRAIDALTQIERQVAITALWRDREPLDPVA